MKRHGLQHESDIAHGRYERNTNAVENGLADILMTAPRARAVIMVGAYRPCAEFITLARNSGLNALFLNVSFVGAEPLRMALNGNGEGVVVTQVVPHYDSDLPAIQNYRKALAGSSPDGQLSFGSLEGYVSGQILLKAIKSINGPINRESIVNALESLGSFDIGLGEPMKLSTTVHQACHRIWPTAILHDRIVPLDWKSLAVGDAN